MSNRYRLKDKEVELLGLKKNTDTKYRLNPSDERLLLRIRTNQSYIKRLFFDIETSPNVVYSWRIGYNLTLTPDNIIDERKIICISYKWEDSDKIYSLKWDKNQCDKQMLIDFIEQANQADELIAHNGDRFDIKWIRTRCIFHRIPMFPQYKTLDTLKKAKNGFNFNSNKLDYIAQFLGVGAKVKHSGFDMWKKVMKNDPEAMDEMVNYCEGDIIVLEDVYFTMQNYIKTNTHNGVINNNLKYSCPNCGSEHSELLKNNVTAMGTIKRLMECNDCDYNFEISNSSYILKLKFNNKI
jgi:hypothetical protein